MSALIEPPRLSDASIAVILAKAIAKLALMAPGISILLPEPQSAATAMSTLSPSGWCEIGVLMDGRHRFWYRVFWHPDSQSGRLLRERPKARRDVLGMCVPPSPAET